MNKIQNDKTGIKKRSIFGPQLQKKKKEKKRKQKKKEKVDTTILVICFP